MMQRILIINPNTTASVTDKVLACCRLAHPAFQWEGVTGRIGAAYIATEGAYALAAHAALDAYASASASSIAQHGTGHDAVLLACFGDPGLLALREVSAVPVAGLAQASFVAAARHGRFAVVTGGKAWGPMLERFARMHQLDESLAGVFTVELNGAQIAQAPQRAIDSLVVACEQGLKAGAQCILLGGAALTGLATTLQSRLGMPVLDNVLLGAQAAVDLATGRPGISGAADRSALPVTGVSKDLTRLFSR
jgi:allantoin racemase